MTEFEEMDPTERGVFVNFMEAAQKASDALETMYSFGETLCNKYGWDIEHWDIAKASMMVEHQTRGNWRMLMQKNEGGGK